MKLLFLDTETTGLDPEKHGVVQIAGIIEINGEEKERFDLHSQIFDEQIAEPKALKVNGLTLEQIGQFPEPTTTHAELKKIWDKYIDKYNKADKFYMVGQNVPFDYGFLDKFFKNCGDDYLYSYINYDKIDLVALTAAFKVAGIYDFKKVNLEAVAEMFNIEFTAHDAAADIDVTRKIFHHYVDQIKDKAIKKTSKKA